MKETVGRADEGKAPLRQGLRAGRAGGREGKTLGRYKLYDVGASVAPFYR